MSRIAVVGPVFPYRSGVAYCTTRLAEELGADVFSFKRQYPNGLYPGGSDLDPTLPRADAAFLIDIVNPLTWLQTGLRLRRGGYDAVIFVWYIWVFAVPYLVMMAALRRRTRVILQCHTITEKEPAWWKTFLTRRVLKRGHTLVTHAATEVHEAWKRSGGRRVVKTFLPVHELGGAMPSREDARRDLKIDAPHVALFFGHVRPFKGLDIVIRAWRDVHPDTLLLVAGEAWWSGEQQYRKLAEGIGNIRFEFRYITDAEVATYFAASDVVVAAYRQEAQSGVALTSFHFGRPLIASNVGGLPEIVDGTNGILVEPENPAAVARAVNEFFSERDRPAMERRAAECARQYSWPEYAKVFRGLIDGR